MKKIFIWLLALAGVFTALLVGAVVIIPKFISIESYIPQIEEKVAEATGRSFSLGDDFNVSVFPWAGVSFSNLELGNPQAYGGGQFVKVKSFEARVKLLPLLTKKIEINKFVLDGPEINLVKLEGGQGNWSIGKKDSPAAQKNEAKPDESPGPKEGKTDFSLTSLEVGEFAVTNGRLVFLDKGAKLTKKVENINFKLNDISLERPVNIMFQADVDGHPVSVNGSVGPIGKTPGKGTVRVNLAVKAVEQLDAKLSGEIVEPAAEPNFKMNLQVAQFSLRQMLETLKIALPVKTSDPTVLNKISLSLEVQGNPQNITLKNSSVVLDDSRLTIAANIKDMESPNVSFQLGLDAINLDRYLPPPAGSKSSDTNTPAATSTPAAEGVTVAEPVKIDYQPLRKLILSGKIQVGELIAHGAKIQNFDMKIAGREGIFDLDPFKLDLYQGSFGMVGKFNVQGEQPQGDVDLQAQSIQVGPLLKDALKKEILEGNMNAGATISFAGDTPEAIKKTLNGVGELLFVDGALVGIDIAEMGRSFAKGLGYEKPAEKPHTDFAELKVPFEMVNGKFQTSNTSLLSPLLRMKAMGSADLVSEKLDFKVRPKIVGTLKGQGDKKQRSGLTVPILVEGTFSKPEYSADLSDLASRENLEQAIKDPEGTKKKLKSVEESGKALLKSFGFGN